MARKKVAKLKGVDVLASGAMRIRVSAGVDPRTGERRMLTEIFPAGTSTETIEARRGELLNKAKRMRGKAVPKPSTLGELLEKYQALPRLANSTRAKDQSACKHLTLQLRRTVVDRLNGWDLDELYTELLEAGVGVPTIQTLHGAIRSACSQGMKWGECESNPASRATPPTLEETEVEIPADDVIASLLTATANNEMHRVMLELYLGTGCRAAEALAIRWSSIDHANSTLQISASIERGTERTVAPTKGRRWRTISIDPTLMAIITRWQTAQRERALAAPSRTLADDPYLFSADWSSSRPMSAHQPTRQFDRWRTRAAKTVPAAADVHLHQMRHYHASNLLADGVDVYAVAYRLGHSSVTTTQRVYAHIIKGRDRVSSDTIARRLERLRPAGST